eukprot:sb/3465105/
MRPLFSTAEEKLLKRERGNICRANRNESRTHWVRSFAPGVGVDDDKEHDCAWCTIGFVLGHGEMERGTQQEWLFIDSNINTLVRKLILNEPTETSKQPTRSDYQPIRDQHLLIQSVPDFLKPTETSKQPIRTGYLGQPIRDQYFLIRSVPAAHHNQSRVSFIIGLAANQNSLSSRDWLSANQGPVLPGISDCLFTCFGRFLMITFKLQVTLYLLSITHQLQIDDLISGDRARKAMVSISIAADQSTLVKRRAGDRTARSENAALRTKLSEHTVENKMGFSAAVQVQRLMKLTVDSSSAANAMEPTDTSKRSIRTRYLGHVTGYQPIRIQYFLIRSVPNKTPCSQLPNLNTLYGGAIPHLIIKSEQTVMHFQSIGLTQFSLLSLGARELWSEHWPDKSLGALRSCTCKNRAAPEI